MATDKKQRCSKVREEATKTCPVLCKELSVVSQTCLLLKSSSWSSVTCTPPSTRPNSQPNNYPERTITLGRSRAITAAARPGSTPPASPVCKHTAPHVNDELICLPTPSTVPAVDMEFVFCLEKMFCSLWCWLWRHLRHVSLLLMLQVQTVQVCA